MRKTILRALFLAAVGTPLAADAQARLVVAGSDILVTRLCEVYSRGDMYCRNVDQLLQNEWRNVDPAALQSSFQKVYEDRGFDQRHNGLMSCGSGTFAAAPQSRGAMPTAPDLRAGRNSCLRELEKRMGSFGGAGRGRGRGGVFGGAPWNPGSGGGSSWTGTTCKSAGDPTRGEDLSGDVKSLTESTHREYLRDWYYNDEEKLRAAAAATTDEEDRRLLLDMAEDAKRAAEYQERLRKAAERAEAEAAAAAGGDKGRTGAGQSSCQEVDASIRAFLDECERNGWTSYECQKMKACSDPAVTNPNPGGPAIRSAEAGGPGSGPGETGGGGGARDKTGVRCGDVPIFGDDDFRRALLEYCDERAKYGPDGGGRCASFDANGSTANIARAACGPRAFPTEDGCLGTVQSGSLFPSFRRNLQSELLTARKKLGGPVVVIPVRNPTAPGVGPRPRPGSSAQTQPTGGSIP